MLLGLPSVPSGLSVLDIVHSEALGGDALALGTAGAGPVPFSQVLPLHPHAQQVEAARAAVTQRQGTALGMVHLHPQKVLQATTTILKRRGCEVSAQGGENGGLYSQGTCPQDDVRADVSCRALTLGI